MSVYQGWINAAVSAALSGATVKAMLVTDAYVPDPTETTAPTGSEVSGTGYTAGGVDVTSLIAVNNDTTDFQVQLTLSAAIDFGDITVTGIGGVLLYISGGQPLAVDMFESTDWPGGSSFVYTADSDGFLLIQAG